MSIYACNAIFNEGLPDVIIVTSKEPKE